MQTKIWAIILSGFLLPFGTEAAEPLTLTEAESLINQQDPSFERFGAQAEALENAAIADGQLPDPRIKVGVVNLPTNTFDFSQEPMTQAVVGVSQSFPPFGTLSLKTARTRHLADKQRAMRSAETLDAELAVRLDWLEAHYWSRAIEVLQDSKSALRNVIGATTSRFATGIQRSEDLVRTELELSIVEDRELEARRKLEDAQSSLVRWLGAGGKRPIDSAFPDLPPPGDLETLRAGLSHHPRITELDAETAAKRNGMEIAERRYYPDFSLEAQYGYRNRDFNGRSLPDFASFMVNMSVPIFPWNRQDKEVARSRLEMRSAEFGRAERLIEFNKMLDIAWSNWSTFGERVDLYEKALRAQAEENIDASLVAYQSDVTDFSTLMRAQLTEIDTRLRGLRVRVDQAKAQSQLLYLKATAE